METAIKARLTLTGISPLVLNNGQLADPTNEYTIQIAQIVSKGTRRTPEEREQEELLTWRGSLYVTDGQLVFPVNAILRSFERGGVLAGKLGTKTVAGVIATQTEVPLDYEGPRELDKLAADSRFRFRTLVNPNPSSAKKGKVPRMRPIFPSWSLTVEVIVMSEALGWDDFCRVVRLAGQMEGIGNARKLGMGRYEVEIKKL